MTAFEGVYARRRLDRVIAGLEPVRASRLARCDQGPARGRSASSEQEMLKPITAPRARPAWCEFKTETETAGLELRRPIPGVVQVLLFALGAAGVRYLGIFNNTEFLMLTLISMTQAIVAILINARTLRRTIGVGDNG